MPMTAREARVVRRTASSISGPSGGCRPRQPKNQGYGSAYIFGAVRPARDEKAALVPPRADTEAMQLQLQECGHEKTRPGSLSGPTG